MTYNRKEQKDIYQEITDAIITAMESGKLPWQQAWDSKVASGILRRPMNGKTGRPYTKGNSLYLSLIMQKLGENDDPRFFTFKQAMDAGYSVRAGSHGTAIKLGFFATKDRYGEPLPQAERHWTYIIRTVFHASQCCVRVPVLDKDGKQVMEPILDKYHRPRKDKAGKALERKVFCDTPLPAYKSKIQGYTHDEQITLAAAVLQRSGAKIYHDQTNYAFYTLGADVIHLPPKEAFKDLAGYYATALHELGHWTGHPSRLNRDLNGGFGSPDYAKEELRAEIASAYLSMDLGLPLNTISHAAYTQSWLHALKNDKKEFFRAANEAQTIAAYITNFVQDKLKVRDEAIIPDFSDKNNTSGKEVAVTIYQAPVSCPWVFQEFNAVHNEIDFSQYVPVYQDRYSMALGVEKILDTIYKRHNEPGRPSAQAMRSVSMSDIIQLDNRNFYVDTVGFTEIQIEKQLAHTKQSVKVIEMPAVRQEIDEQSRAVDNKRFEQYQHQFRTLFAEGATFSRIDCIGHPEKQYAKFIYSNAVRYGLSAIRPDAAEAWKMADQAFIKTFCEDSLGSASALAVAACTVQAASPYMAVDPERNYGFRLGKEVLSLRENRVENKEHSLLTR